MKLNKTRPFSFTAAVFVFISLTAHAADIPDLHVCDAIVLRTSGGWWLRVKHDGSGAYGFGALMDSVEVGSSSFDFRQLYRQTRRAIVEHRQDAQAPYIAVSYHCSDSASSREWYLLQHRSLLVELMQKARDNALAPLNEIEKRWHKKIDSIWQHNNPLLWPNKQDAGDGR